MKSLLGRGGSGPAICLPSMPPFDQSEQKMIASVVVEQGQEPNLIAMTNQSSKWKQNSFQAFRPINHC